MRKSIVWGVLVLAGIVTVGTCLLKSNHRTEPVQEESPSARVERLERFWFLADAPLLIDQQDVETLFDTIYRPDFEWASRTSSATKEQTESANIELTGKSEIPAFLKPSLELKGSLGRENKESEESSLSEVAVKTAEGRLEKLVGLYVASFPSRFLWIESSLAKIQDLAGRSLTWREVDDLITSRGLRPMVVLDLEKGTRLLPVFAESSSGKTLNLSNAFARRRMKQLGKAPIYPQVHDRDFDVKVLKYWGDLAAVFDSQVAIETIEELATPNSRIDWIAYEILPPSSTGGAKPVHLRVNAYGKYATGTLAYEFVRRAELYGARVVGSLKRGEDVDVLAIYNR